MTKNSKKKTVDWTVREIVHLSSLRVHTHRIDKRYSGYFSVPFVPSIGGRFVVGTNLANGARERVGISDLQCPAPWPNSETEAALGGGGEGHATFRIRD